MDNLLKLVLGIVAVYVVTGMAKKDCKSIQRVIQSSTTDGDTPNRHYRIQQKNKISSQSSSNNNKCIIFSAPGCPHCVDATPEFEKTLKIAKKEGIDVKIEKGHSEAKKYGVQYFPTILIIDTKTSKQKEFKGPRKATAIIDAIKKMN